MKDENTTDDPINAREQVTSQSQSVDILSSHTQKRPSSSSRKVLVFSIALILLLSIATALYYITGTKSADETAPTTTTLNQAKPQFYMDDNVAGYVTYNPEKFEEVESKLPTIEKVDTDVNTIIFTGSSLGFEGDPGIYLYDLAANKTYRLLSQGGDPRIMSDHFLAYADQEGSGTDKKFTAKVLDLQTGESNTVFSGAREDVAGDFCCNVSPDGFLLLWTQTNKLSVWDIRTYTTKDFAVNVRTVGEGFTEAYGDTDYTTEMSYATPAWLDNDTVIFADKPATKYELRADEVHKPVIDTNLFSLDLATGTTRELPTGSGGIYSIYTRGDRLFMEEAVDTGATTLFQVNLASQDAPEPLRDSFNFFELPDFAGDKVFFFPTLHEASEYQVLDVATGTQSVFAPYPSSLSDSISQVIPQGFVAKDRIIVRIMDTDNNPSREYIAVYNTTSNKVEQHTLIGCQLFTEGSSQNCMKQADTH